MAVIDVGSGPAIVLIPGIQGRWEWMRRSVAELAGRWRVVTSSLPGEPGVPRLPPEGGFDELVRHVDTVLDSSKLASAVLCGVSFGGLVALRYAAVHPERVRALILVSAPGPVWRPAPRQARYMSRPVLRFPLFLAEAARRTSAELRATFPGRRRRLAFYGSFGVELLKAPGIPWRMAARARLAAAERFDGDCVRVTVPTLVVAGESGLDRVIDAEDAMDYVKKIPGAVFRRLERTGHLGTATSPAQFAQIVSAFLEPLEGP